MKTNVEWYPFAILAGYFLRLVEGRLYIRADMQSEVVPVQPEGCSPELVDFIQQIVKDLENRL